MKDGDWIRLGPTLSFGEGLYKIVNVGLQTVTVRGEDGRRHSLSHHQVQTLTMSTATPKRRTATRATFFRQEHGVLAAAGYHVGASGFAEARRRAILSWVFEAPLIALPKEGDEAYMAEWGEARTVRRFNKISSCLLSFAQNGLARRDPPLVAIEDWQADLQWFYDTYAQHLEN